MRSMNEVEPPDISSNVARTININEIKYKFLAAGIASTISTLLLTPFDVVKVRMQAMQGTKRMIPGSIQYVSCSHTNVCRRHVPYNLPKASMLDTTRLILQQGGARGLWKGMSTSLLLTVPAVGVYMPLYDHLLKEFAGLGNISPLLAGAGARAVATVFISPLELVRTRIQATSGFSSSEGLSQTFQQMRHIAAQRGSSAGFLSLWTGTSATLMRDVPFSAIYWGFLEPTRSALQQYQNKEELTSSQLLTTNATAGAMSGALASLVTMPFDVVKTKVQVDKMGTGEGMWHGLKQIVEKDGMSALFTGAVPRVIRIAPACAIVISCYELMKRCFSSSDSIA